MTDTSPSVVTIQGMATPPGIARKYGIAVATVHSAIRDGRLPAVRVPGDDRGSRGVYLIRIEDADVLWATETHRSPDAAMRAVSSATALLDMR